MERVDRGGNEEGAGFGNRLAWQVDQRVVDARVADASGCEKKSHDSGVVEVQGYSIQRTQRIEFSLFHVDSLQRRSTILLFQQNTDRGEWTCASSAL
jgi:hypothetical protein